MYTGSGLFFKISGPHHHGDVPVCLNDYRFCGEVRLTWLRALFHRGHTARHRPFVRRYYKRTNRSRNFPNVFTGQWIIRSLAIGLGLLALRLLALIAVAKCAAMMAPIRFGEGVNETTPEVGPIAIACPQDASFLNKTCHHA